MPVLFCDDLTYHSTVYAASVPGKLAGFYS
jgi:hypothetical protein